VRRNVEPPGAVSARPESEPREVVHLALRSPALAGAIERDLELRPAVIADPAGGPAAAPAVPPCVAGEVDPRALPVICAVKSTSAARSHPLVPAVQPPMAQKPGDDVGWSMRRSIRSEDEQCAPARKRRDERAKLHPRALRRIRRIAEAAGPRVMGFPHRGSLRGLSLDVATFPREPPLTSALTPSSAHSLPSTCELHAPPPRWDLVRLLTIP
jgi:hypothetical protein